MKNNNIYCKIFYNYFRFFISQFDPKSLICFDTSGYLPELDSTNIYTESFSFQNKVYQDSIYEYNIQELQVSSIKTNIVCGSRAYPTANLPDDTILCTSYSITLNPVELDTAGFNYYWNTGDTTRTLTVKESGTYSVDVSHNFFTSTDSITLIFTQKDQCTPNDSAIFPYDSI